MIQSTKTIEALKAIFFPDAFVLHNSQQKLKILFGLRQWNVPSVMRVIFVMSQQPRIDNR